MQVDLYNGRKTMIVVVDVVVVLLIVMRAEVVSCMWIGQKRAVSKKGQDWNEDLDSNPQVQERDSENTV